MNTREHQRKREELNRLMLEMLSSNLLEKLTNFSEPCTPHKASVAKKLVNSASGTPVQGLEEIVPATWVPGPLTHVQRMSPNSAALALLTGFAEGSIQMQR